MAFGYTDSPVSSSIAANQITGTGTTNDGKTAQIVNVSGYDGTTTPYTLQKDATGQSILTQLQGLVENSGSKPQASATLASVTAATTSTTILAASSSTHNAVVYNDSTAVLYLAFAATASTTAYTVQVPAGGYFEMPKPAYQGIITGIWSAANGAARVTSW